MWSTVLQLVPSEAPLLLAAKPRVEIVDLGERYRVRVAAAGGGLERVYADPARDCEKRTRFAAEFIVVSLLPPQLGIAPDAATSQSGSPPSGSAPARAAPPAPPAPAPSGAPNAAASPSVMAPGSPHAHETRSSVVRIELSAIGEASLPLGAPGLLTWGAALRVGVGGGRWAGVAGIAYLPGADFAVGDFQGRVTRVPAIAGVREQLLKRSWQVDGDLALSLAFERYEGVSPHAPSTATRATPGIELGIVASPRAVSRLAPIAALRCAWFPLTQELAAAPQGSLGNTPSFWIGLELGLSLEL